MPLLKTDCIMWLLFEPLLICKLETLIPLPRAGPLTQSIGSQLFLPTQGDESGKQVPTNTLSSQEEPRGSNMGEAPQRDLAAVITSNSGHPSPSPAPSLKVIPPPLSPTNQFQPTPARNTPCHLSTPPRKTPTPHEGSQQHQGSANMGEAPQRDLAAVTTSNSNHPSPSPAPSTPPLSPTNQFQPTPARNTPCPLSTPPRKTPTPPEGIPQHQGSADWDYDGIVADAKGQRGIGVNLLGNSGQDNEQSQEVREVKLASIA